jgi:hypothetical protein
MTSISFGRKNDTTFLSKASVVHEPLQYSDDGQLSRELAISLVELGVSLLKNLF